MGRFVSLENQTSFRRMAAAMWTRPNDPTIYGNSEIDMTKALALIDQQRTQGVKLTVTHLVAKALAVALARHPEFNAKVRFWGKLERRKTVDIFIQVASEEGRDLSGHLVRSADKLSLVELAQGLRDAAQRIRTDADPNFKKSKSLIKMLPWWILMPFLAIASVLTNELHFDLSSQGMPDDPFGTAMVTSLGMHGVDEAYAPMTPVARCMMLMLVPAVNDRVVVENGMMVIKPMIKLCATFDHRVIDGFGAAILCRELRALLAEPTDLIA